MPKHTRNTDGDRADDKDAIPKPSDQMPEEGHPDHVVDDVPEAGEGAARESARRHARAARQRAPSDSA
ncbi:MAG TPA: hypothetical protein VHX88_09860 [Solirubrobacteraceae bacterium]|jgi:hypothetical protein|nr:hypothetical protein [Solirubrobacteraceae bacterium]